MPPEGESYWCRLHGTFRSLTGQCRWGCGGHRVVKWIPRAAQQEKSTTELVLEAIERETAPRLPTGGYPTRSPDAASYDQALGRERDRRGRFLPYADDGSPPHPDERMSDPEVRMRLRQLLSHLPRGSKKGFARLCYRGRSALSTVRGVAYRDGLLPDACRRRISRVLYQIGRRELVLVKTAQCSPTGRPIYVWQPRAGRYGRARQRDRAIPARQLLGRIAVPSRAAQRLEEVGDVGDPVSLDSPAQ